MTKEFKSVALTGGSLFVHLVEHFKMSGFNAIQDMKEHNQNLKWFDELPKGTQQAILNDR